MSKQQQPAWTGADKAQRTKGKAATVIALYLLKDRVDLSDRGAVSAKLGISRWTLGRYLATIAELEDLIQETIKKLED